MRVPVVVVDVLALPDRGLRNDDDGVTVREFEFDRDDDPARGEM